MVTESLCSKPGIQASRRLKAELCPARQQGAHNEALSPLCALYLKGAFANPVAQVVKFGPTHLATSSDLNFRDAGGMELEDPLNSFAVGDLPHGKG